MTIRWHPRAIQDRIEIFEFIERDSQSAAVLVDDRILRATQFLAGFPEMGHKGRRKGTRELVIRRTGYIAAYSFKDRTVLILRLIHSRQRRPNKMS